MKKLTPNLAVCMAKAGVPSLAELERRLNAAGYPIEKRTLYKLYHNNRSRIEYMVLEGVCNILGCGIEELLILEHEKRED